jgi:hypothetical protein
MLELFSDHIPMQLFVQRQSRRQALEVLQNLKRTGTTLPDLIVLDTPNYATSAPRDIVRITVIQSHLCVAILDSCGTQRCTLEGKILMGTVGNLARVIVLNRTLLNKFSSRI